jgi:uncharacterized membrane protein
MRKYFSRSYWLDRDIERVMGNMLRLGVIVSAIISAIGGILYLSRSGSQNIPSYQNFVAKPSNTISLKDIVIGSAHLQSTSIMLLGILVLIATPIMRVVFSFFAFLLERDYLYVVLTLIVLCIIGTGIFGGFV